MSLDKCVYRAAFLVSVSNVVGCFLILDEPFAVNAFGNAV